MRFCPSVIDYLHAVADSPNAFHSNDFLLCGALSQFKNNNFKKKFTMDDLTRIESGLIRLLNPYMYISY
jgi:hypothetical protein